MNEGSKRYQFVGLVGTVVWATLIGIYLISKEINPLELQPNEFGDFLAGILGPLGILWIVLGFWQQGDELRSSVAALNLQSEELRNSVEQQRQLVNVTREKAEAELKALAEERRSRRIAISPRFILGIRGGMRSGDRVSTNFVLQNVGADAFHVSVSAKSNDEEIFHYEDPAFSRGSEQGFQYEILRGEEKSFVVQVNSIDREEYPVNIRYFVSPEGSDHRYSIVEEYEGLLPVGS